MTEDEMVGQHHCLNGRGLKQAPGVGDGQGILVCCTPWGHKELDTTETELKAVIRYYNLKSCHRYTDTIAFDNKNCQRL